MVLHDRALQHGSPPPELWKAGRPISAELTLPAWIIKLSRPQPQLLESNPAAPAQLPVQTLNHIQLVQDYPPARSWRKVSAQNHSVAHAASASATGNHVWCGFFLVFSAKVTPLCTGLHKRAGGRGEAVISPP
jgi:hypothetical protein